MDDAEARIGGFGVGEIELFGGVLEGGGLFGAAGDDGEIRGFVDRDEVGMVKEKVEHEYERRVRFSGREGRAKGNCPLKRTLRSLGDLLKASRAVSKPFRRRAHSIEHRE